uniref:Uncharacterized protein n=1 Tax=Aplanochytrium stocchinoi TaxID=215587 RepID=A0A7S3PQD1_9STRA
MTDATSVEGEEMKDKKNEKGIEELNKKRSLELYSFLNTRAIANDRLGLPSSIAQTQQRLETATKAQLATIFVFAIAQKYGNFMRESWPHLLYCLLRLSDLDLVPASLALESKDDLVVNSLRLQYHENIRAALLKEAVERVRREREKTEYAAVGWLSSWLFGESTPGENALLNNSEDHYALLSSTRIADASVGHKTQMRKVDDSEQGLSKSIANGQTSANANANANASASQSHSHSSSKRKDALECIKRCHLHGFVTDTAKLSEPALIALVKALVVASGGKLVSVERLRSSQGLTLSEVSNKANGTGAGTGTDSNKDVPINLTKKESIISYAQDDRSVDKLSSPSMASWLFGLHLITEVTLVNYLRMEKIWHLVEDRFLEVIEASKLSPNYHLETVSVGLLRIACVNLVCDKATKPMKIEMLNILQLLLAISEDVAPGLSLLVTVTCKKLFVEYKSKLLLTLKSDDSETWSKVTTLFILMADQVEDAAMVGFETVRHVLVEGSTRDIIPVRHALAILMSFTNRHGVENSKVAEEALGLVLSLHTRLEPAIRKIIDTGGDGAREEANDRSVIQNEWIPLITEITGVVRNPHHPPSTQFSALNHLKKALLDVHGQALTGGEWGTIIEKVLFALCESVLNSSPDDDHDVEAEKTRAYGVMILVIDVVKQYKAALTKQLAPNRFESLWIQIIKYLERFKKIIPGDEVHKQLEELERMSTA